MQELSILAKLRERARNLRRRSTDAEQALWKELRGRRFRAVKFRRQQRVGPYIVDFYSFDRKLAIEVDGGNHANPDARRYDSERSAYLGGAGIRVIRFWNNDVLTNVNAVLMEIDETLFPPSPALRLPSPAGRGESVQQ